MADGEVIKLVYWAAARGKAECIRMLLNAAEANFEDVRIDGKDWFADPSIKKEAPYGQLPYVVYKGRKLTQSVPIATYFAKKFGFYGKTDEDALRQEEIMHLAEDFSFPHFKDWFFAKDQAKADMTEKLKAERIPQYLGYFESMLKENGDSGFFVGDSMTLADIFMEEVVETTLSIDPEALTSFPLLQKMCTNVQTYPALQTYLANRPKSAV